MSEYAERKGEDYHNLTPEQEIDGKITFPDCDHRVYDDEVYVCSECGAFICPYCFTFRTVCDKCKEPVDELF